MEATINGYVIDWANILFVIIATEIQEYRRKVYTTSQIIPPFYYNAYILDIICFNFKYSVLGLKWTSQDPNPIHIYQKQLRKAHYKNHLYRICNGFVLLVYYSILNKPVPKISQEAEIDLMEVGS